MPTIPCRLYEHVLVLEFDMLWMLPYECNSYSSHAGRIMIYIIQIRNLSALKYLVGELGIGDLFDLCDSCEP